MDRRGFLAGAMGTAVAALSGCGLRAAVPLPVERDRIRLRVSNHPRLAEPGGALKVRPDGGQSLIYILRTPEGYVAVSPICTHLGCTVDVEGARLVCPCHGSTYDRSGRVVRGPAERPLRRYPVQMRTDGILEIMLDGSTAS